MEALLQQVRWLGWAGAVLELAKPKVVLLIVFTAIVGMLLAGGAQIAWDTVFWATLGIALASASGAAINQIIEADLDARMQRTHGRPLPRARLSHGWALAIAASWALISMAVLVWQVNLLTASLTFLALIGYAVIYTVFLKYNTPQNIVWGGAAGAAPPLLGFTAMNGAVTLDSIILFLIIFLWTPPHFWPLAIHRVRDYARSHVPMLPVTHGIAHTKDQIVLYAIALGLVSLAPLATGMSGWIYGLAALGLNGWFIKLALALRRDPEHRGAMRLFGFSIVHLAVLFGALLVDRFLPLLWGG